MSGYAIRFTIEGGGPPFYAGKTPDGALGFANSLETAEVWPDEEVAARFLENGFGPNMRSIGTVVAIVDGEEVS